MKIKHVEIRGRSNFDRYHARIFRKPCLMELVSQEYALRCCNRWSKTWCGIQASSTINWDPVTNWEQGEATRIMARETPKQMIKISKGSCART
ncbi:hypothetical protein RRG08_009257 [Elysia crispata]|uniref:Uncharacterized protein n=1 Tax=Elysia crispata TaxID=231223 RepID=A0AAE1AZG3_9GAST|nr:hypothetical protein RRG08_009257 [Elysia crispata]